jgi:3' terminal RNA ribose 2'-O-methyltransferase Hen1
MLLTISTTYRPAADLGYLLEKHPARVHEFELAGGKATVFYPEVGEERCTVALLLEVDPVGLVRSNRPEAALEQYVNDRPYVASSLLSVALNTAFRSALGGRSRSRAELAVTPIPLQAYLPVLRCRGGAQFLRSLFEPLGYELTLHPLPLDTQFAEWGDSPYFSVTLAATCTLQHLLQHLYVLIPVLDDDKHYWVGDAEIDKLLRHAEQWLAAHPQRERIVLRYLKHRRSLAHEALGRLTPEEATHDDLPEAAQPEPRMREQLLERKSNLNEQRIAAVQAAIAEQDTTSVVDLGCGEGKILAALLQLKQLDKVVGMDVSLRSLEHAQERLKLDRLPPRARQRISLWHGSLIYRDARLAGFDAATLIEVIEHLDPGRLAALERVVFEFARPRHVIVTTPNREYNVRYTTLPPGQFRHGDHRFEWTRAEFGDWCEQQVQRFGYRVAYRGIGEEDAELGPPTQMALFSLPSVAQA